MSEKKMWKKTKEGLQAFEVEPNPERLRDRIAPLLIKVDVLG